MTERRAHGTLVVRDGRIAEATEGLAALTGRSIAELVGSAPLDLLAPEDRPRVAALGARAARGEAVPQALELSLLLADGGRRPVEWHLDREGGAELVHVRDLGEEARRRALVAALAELGANLRAERSVEGVHARVREQLGRLGAVCALIRGVEGRSRIVWSVAPPELEREFRAVSGGRSEGFSGPMSAFARRVLAEGCAYIDDWAMHAPGYLPDADPSRARDLVERAGFSRTIAVRIDAPAEALYLAIASPVLRSDDVPAVRLFGAQVSAALDAARTIADLSRRNAHLAVLARVAELAGEASDLATFLRDAAEVVRPAAGYVACAIFVADEPAGELACVHLDPTAPPALAPLLRRVPFASPLGEVVRTRTARVTGVPYEGADPQILAALRPFRAIAWVPLVSRSRGVGALAAAFERGVEDGQASVELLASVGAHFASAIESHGLLADLRRRVDEQTLLLDVARAAARFDSTLVLEGALRRVCATAGIAVGAAWVREGDRLVLHSSAGLDDAEAARVAALPLQGGAVGRAIALRAPVPVSACDALEGALPGGRCASLGAAVAVPLLAKGEPMGALLLARDAGGPPFGEDDLALLSSVGAQLGVALDSARLFADVRGRLADLEAVHALALRVFANAPGDLGALLQDACGELQRTLSARGAVVFLVGEGGETLRAAASTGVTLPVESQALDLRREGLVAQAVRTRAPVQSEDATRDPRSTLSGRTDVPPLAMLAVPLVSRRDVRGLVLVADRAGRHFGPGELAVANALAGALGVGIENAELYADARRRVEELGLLHEVGRSLVETLDLEQVLSGGIRSLARIVDAPAAYLALATPDGAALELRAHFGATPDVRAGLRAPTGPRAQGGVATLVFERREPVLVEDAEADPRVSPEVRRRTGARAYLGLPLVVHDRCIGTVVIVETRRPRLFTPAEVERAAAIANQLAVAAENARLYEDLRRSYSELGRAQRQLVQGERLAALGEMAAVVAHEVRNPLGVIFNSLGSLRRLLRPAGDAKLLFEIVQEEADRLNRIVGDLLDFARPSAPEVRPEQLERVAEDAVAAAVPPQAEIRIVRELDPDLPPVPVDARLVRQAIVNLAVNAVQAMPRGGRLTVRTRREGDAAVVELEDTGAGIPDEVRARMFEPFFTTKASGTGLGLAVVRRIVEGHGGQVRVRSAPGAGTAFSLRFPLAAAVENDPSMR